MKSAFLVRNIAYPLFFLLIYSLSGVYCHGLTIIIRGDQERTLELEGKEIVGYQYHPVEVNGQSYDSLSEIPPENFDTEESIVFHIHSANGGTGTEPVEGLSDEVMARLKRLLKEGYANVLLYLPVSALLGMCISAGPSCGQIMAHLYFGIMDFMVVRDVASTPLEFQKVQDLVGALQPGDMIQINNLTLASCTPRDTLLYIGGTLFLGWENNSSKFHFISAAQLDNNLPDAYSFQKVTGIEKPTEEQEKDAAELAQTLLKILTLKEQGSNTASVGEATGACAIEPEQENKTGLNVGAALRTATTKEEGPLFMTGHSYIK